MAKIIRTFDIDLSDMAASGGSRSFSIIGDVGAIFSLEVKNEDSHYYNFSTNVFSATKAKLKQKAIPSSGKFVGNILFPSITDDDQYDIYLWAESAYDTKHTPFSEVRFGDDTLDINLSTGSNSNLVQKVIYQYTDTTITIYPFMQTLSGNAVDWLTSYVADTIVVGRGKNSAKQSFSCTVTTPTTKALRILRQPTIQDFFKELAVHWEPYAASSGAALSGDGPVLIQGEDIWARAAYNSSGTTDGQTRGSSALNMGGGASSATKLIVDALPSHTQVGDRLTGWLHPDSGLQNCLNAGAGRDTQVVTISAINPDGDNANEFSVNVSSADFEGLTIADDHTLYFNAPYYHRYKTKSSLGGYGVLGLRTGLKEVDKAVDANPSQPGIDAGGEGTRPNTLSSYIDSTTYTVEVVEEDGSVREEVNTVTNISYPAIDTTEFKPTITNGKVTKQDGTLTFASPLKIDTAVAGLEGNTWFLVRGLDWVKEIHNTEIKVTNLKVALTPTTTTTTSTVSNSTTVPVADREGTIRNVSTVSGIGIAAGVANPTVTSATADGAGSWTLSAAQTLESGITLTVENTSRVATITGDIEVVSCGDSNFTLILDVPNFLIGA